VSDHRGITPERLGAIRARWDGAVTGLYPSGTEEADYRDVHELLAEVDRFHSWHRVVELRGAGTRPNFASAISTVIDLVEDEFPGPDVEQARRALHRVDSPDQVDALADLVAAGVERLRWMNNGLKVASDLFSEDPARDVRAWVYGLEAS
jgi:hypothetical protein